MSKLRETFEQNAIVITLNYKQLYKNPFQFNILYPCWRKRQCLLLIRKIVINFAARWRGSVRRRIFLPASLPCGRETGLGLNGKGPEKQIKEINNLYNFNVMFTKQSMPQCYEAPTVRVHLFSAESGFASSVDGNNISRWVEDDSSSEPTLSF